MSGIYPLILEPIFKRRVWGGRGLEPFFSSALPSGPVGEAWVLGEHPQGTNIVTNGSLAGASLSHLRRDFGSDLLGSRGTSSPTGRCPLLIKLLHARDDLSVQVHPPDGYKGLPSEESGKTEMWYVLAAEPGAQVVFGLQEGVTQSTLAAAIAERRIEGCIRRIPVYQGDVLVVPAGTVHALGKGIVVAEVQQSSDTTYRLYDYDRPDFDGRLRPLQLDQAMRVTSFDFSPAPVRRQTQRFDEWQELAATPYFLVLRAHITRALRQRTTTTSFDAVLVCEGEGEIVWSGGREKIRMGQAVMVPARLGLYELSGRLGVLLARLP